MPMAQVGRSGVLNFHDFDPSMRDAVARNGEPVGGDQDWHFDKEGGPFDGSE
jgi:hypothetical protein